MALRNRIGYPTTTELDGAGDGLCGTCKRKFPINQLETCCYCDKWCCRIHRSKSRVITEGWVCDICKKEQGAK